ncbi:MAG: carboxypeptidase regulatory-like domain-containing protein [Planctomycetes bacterium]|nr:carboxypeptidase regulatory-like domain-containing protein [Planctomycetota bacterium]
MRKLVVVALALTVLLVWWFARGSSPEAARTTTKEPAPTDEAPTLAATSAESAERTALASETPKPPPSARESKPSPHQRLVDRRIRGRVIDAISRAPISDAVVAVIDMINGNPDDETNPRADTVHAEARTDLDGRFELPFATNDLDVLRADAVDHGRRIVRLMGPAVASGDELVIALEHGARLDVVVTGASAYPGLEVIAGVDFRELVAVAWPTNEWRAGAQFWIQTLDVDERASFVDLPGNANFWLALRHGETILQRRSTPVRLTIGETKTLEWALGASARVRVRTLERDGTTATGVDIALISSRAAHGWQFFERRPSVAVERTTDADGIAVLEAVAAGDWLLLPSAAQDSEHPELAIAPLAVPLHVGEDDRELAIDVTLERGLYLRGHVVDPSDSPLPGMQLSVRSDDRQIYVGRRADADGSFEFGPCPSGTYTLSAGDGDAWAVGEPVRARAPADGLVLRVAPGGWLTASFVDERGEPVHGADVLWLDGGVLDYGSAWGTKLEDSVFEHSGVALRAWTIVGTTADGRIGCESVVATPARETAPARIALRPGARWTLVGGPLGGRCIASQDGRVVAIARLADTATRSLVVPAGTVTLTLVGTGAASPPTLEFEAVAGESREIDLSLAR